MDGGPDALSPEGVAALASFVIRPPRADYSRRELGERSFTIDDVPGARTDLELVNARGLRLQCSHFEPAGPPAPCVVYLHGNGSCRVEATMLLHHLIPYGIGLFAFDFSGSGRSDGEYISLGVREKDDVDTVVAHLLTSRSVPRVALWGHSMGAATALMYAGLCKPPAALTALVLDSPFSSFDKLADAMVAEMPIPPGIPRKLILSVGTRAVRRNVRERAGFDVFDIDPMAAVKKLSPASAPPAYFLHGAADTVVPASHSRALHAAYPGTAKSVRVLPALAHDTPRPEDALERVFEFVLRALAPGGPAGLDYLVQLKARGNLCMLTGRFSDAAFLYSAALDALAQTAVQTDFAAAVGAAAAGSADPAARRARIPRRRWAPLRVATMRFHRGAHSTARPTPCDVASDPGLAGNGGCGGGGERASIDPDSASTLKPSATGRAPGRAKSFLQSLRARMGARARDGSEKRRGRSGRFAKAAAAADRRDEFRSFGSGARFRGDARASGDARVSGDTARDARTSADTATAECEHSAPGDRFARPAPAARGADDGAGGARRVPRFSHDGWRRRGRARRAHAGGSVGSLGGLGFARTMPDAGRAASVDLRALDASSDDASPGATAAAAAPGIAGWGLDAPRTAAALALLGNRSLARRKLASPRAALADAELCVQLDPAWVRGHLRRAAALRALERDQDAREAAEDGLRADPGNKQLRDLRDAIDAAAPRAPPAAAAAADFPARDGWASEPAPVAAQH